MMRRERPWLATIIGVLFILFGIKDLREIFEGSYASDFTEGIRVLLSHDVLLTVPALLKALFGITAGIGIILGARWGWWLMLVSLFGGLVYNVCIFIIILVHKQKVSDFVFVELLKLSMGIFLRPLLLLYCFKERVFRFFGLKRKAMGYVFPVLAVTAVFISFYLIYVYILYGNPERLFIF